MIEALISRLYNKHDSFVCQGRTCIIHNRTQHHMSDWYVLWRDDRGIFERVCSHGTGHPDPDQFEYWFQHDMEAEKIHGCCGCCSGYDFNGNKAIGLPQRNF